MRNDDLDPACTKTSLAHRLGRQAGDRGLFLPLMPIVPSVGGSKMASGAKHHPFGLEGLAPCRWPTPKILPADKG